MTTLLWCLAVALVLAAYVAWTAGRLDRLHARLDAAWAALDAQLVRRAAAARALVAHLDEPDSAARLEQAAARAVAAGESDRETVENDLSRVLRGVVPLLGPDAPLGELQAAASKVALARSFHNAAVQDTRAVRWRRMPRLLHLAGHRPMPVYFEIDDTSLAG